MSRRASSFDASSIGISRDINSQYDHLVTVAESIESVKTVASSNANLAVVSSNIDDINTVATKISNVEAAAAIDFTPILTAQANTLANAAEAAASELAASDSASAALVSETNASTSELNAAQSEANAAASASAASISESNAATSETNSEASAVVSAASASEADASATAAATSASEALTSENNAAASETASATSASGSAASAANALQSENNAATSETNAAVSETNSSTSATESENWAITPEDTLVPEGNLVDQYSSLHYAAKAASSAASADSSETSASVSATNASTFADNAGTSASNALTSENNAATSESNAATSESNASTSASNAAVSESNAASSAASASTSATNAATSETNAALSATSAANDLATIQTIYDNFDDRYLGQFVTAPTLDNDGNALLIGALYFNTTDETVYFYGPAGWESPELAATEAATQAANSASAASTSETNAASSASAASTSASNASTSAAAALASEQAAATSESNASTSEANALASENAAATSEANAANSENNAATSEINASNSASAAATAQELAETAQTAAEAAYDSFDDRYLGAKAADPVTDNDGNALITGALYFDSTNNVTKVYNGINWQAASSSIEGIKGDFQFIATASQTVFSGNGLAIDQVGLVNVYLNGVRLADSDYTVNPGDNSVTLLAGASANDILEVEVFGNFAGQSGAEVAITGGVITGLTNLETSLLKLTGGTGNEGTLSWNNSDRTLDLDQGGVTLQLGQEMHMMVRNATGSSIGNGTFLGFTGVTAGSNRVMAGPFDTSTMGAHMLVGFATENISNGVNGFVTTFGYVRELDTRGTAASNMAVGDEDWSVGDLLYPHPTVAGKLTKVAPTSGLKVSVAVITNRHSTQGEIFVRVTALDENAYATATQGSNADTAYGWGDHSSVGYLTSYTETDPIFSASEAASITSTNTSNWNTAYGWGNHSTQGYLTSVPSGFSVSSVTVTTANITTVDFGDWTITESGGSLYFATGGTNKMKLDASGNLQVVGSVDSNATIT
jgi:hypothetical protein